MAFLLRIPKLSGIASSSKSSKVISILVRVTIFESRKKALDALKSHKVKIF